MFWVIKDLDYISPSSAVGAVVPKKEGKKQTPDQEQWTVRLSITM